MQKRNNYNTKSRQLILNFLETKKDVTVSALDITEYLKNNGSTINYTTVYRYLNKLCEEKKVLKFIDDKNHSSVYQLLKNEHCCDEHLHIKCIKCGKIVHLECDFMDEIKEHLLKEHDFTLQCKNSILYGLCKNCQNH